MTLQEIKDIVGDAPSGTRFRFSGVWSNSKAKISKAENEEAILSFNNNGTIFICQNIWDGADVDNRYGKRYSFSLRYEDANSCGAITSLRLDFLPGERFPAGKTFKELGLDPKRRFVVVEGNPFKEGEIVKLHYDDDTSAPKFISLADGEKADKFLKNLAYAPEEQGNESSLTPHPMSDFISTAKKAVKRGLMSKAVRDSVDAQVLQEDGETLTSSGREAFAQFLYDSATKEQLARFHKEYVVPNLPEKDEK